MVHLQLKEFTLAVRGVVSRGSYDDQLKQALKPLHISKDKFLDIALKGKYQAPSLKLVMSEEMCVCASSQMSDHTWAQDLSHPGGEVPQR